MTLLYLESFDNITEAQLTEGGRLTRSAHEGFGTSYARFNGNGMYVSTGDYFDKNDFPESSSTMVIGFALKLNEGHNPSDSYGEPFVLLREGDTTHVGLTIDSAWRIKVWNGDGTLLGTSTKRIQPYKWFYIEFKATCNDTTGSFEVRVNGVNWLSDSGIDTRNGASGYLRGFFFRQIYNSVSCFYDDIYVDDSNFLGDVGIKSFLPTEDGTYNDFTPSAGNRFECVDDTTHDSDSTYVEGGTLGDQQTFVFATGTLGTVKGLQLSNVMRKDASGTMRTKNLCLSNGSDYLESDEREVGADYDHELNVWENDPDDSAAWTQAKIEAAEFGLEITST